MRVACVVLNYNGREVTLGAVESLLAMEHPDFEVVVVDNGSTDGSQAAVAARFPQVGVLRTEENLGPAGGANVGLAWGLDHGFDALLVLNNDIEVAPDFLSELVAAAERHGEVGVVGPKSFYYYDRSRIWSAGGELRFGEAVTRETGLGELDRGQFDREREVEYVNGCAMLVKRACLEEVGLWDPQYRLCFEDADFCVRARRAGWRSWYAPRARLWHMVSVTTGGYVPAKTFHSARSTALFVRRHAGPLQWLRALASIAVALPLAYLRELPRRNQAAVTAKWRGYREGFRVPLGPPPRWP